MDRTERSRKTENLILRRLAGMTQVDIARAMGTSESTVSRMVAELSKLADFLAAMRFKVVPEDVECHTTEYMDGLRLFARCGIDVDEDVDAEAQLN